MAGGPGLIRVPVVGAPLKSVQLNTRATEGATFPGNLLDAKGKPYTLATLAAALNSTAASVQQTLAGFPHRLLAGLTLGDDHPQYTRRDTLTAIGDLYYASAISVPSRLGIGTDGQVLLVQAGIPTWVDQGTPPFSPTFADPTAVIGLTVIDGTATTAMRSDAAPPLNQGINPTWTGTHIFDNMITVAGEAVVLVTRAVDTTAPLTGGGALSSDLMLGIDQTALSIAWIQITATPTTLAGYGITDAAGNTPTFVTEANETGTLPNSFQLIAGTNVTFDTSTPNQLKISASGGGGGGTVDSVVGTTNQIDVDSTDPANPIVSLDAVVLAELALAASALQSVTGTANRITVTGGSTIDIASTYVGQTSLTTLGTITTGAWNGTKIGLAYGGTNADLSATGGTSQVLKQTSTGAAITVAQLAYSDISGTPTGAALTKTNDTNVTLTLGGSPTTALLNAASITLGWTGLLGLARGGVNADLSATGGTHQVLKQVSAGAAITVGQLAYSDISGTPTGAALTNTNDTNVTLTLGGSPTTALLNAASITVGWSGTLAIARGGTGQATAAAAFGAFSPLTTKGDVLGFSTLNARIPVGSNNQVLTADSTQTLGLKWAAATGGTAANPSASIGLTAVNGSATTYMRSDGAPALSQAIAPTWTGNHTFSPASGDALVINGLAGSYAIKISGDQGLFGVVNTAGAGVLQMGTVKAWIGSGANVADAALGAFKNLAVYTNGAITAAATFGTDGSLAIAGATTPLYITTGGTTGAKTATFTATNKPGTNNQTTPAIWVPISVGGTIYYFPGFAA
jgi:hypothetical protein